MSLKEIEKIGEMDRRITVRSYTATRNETGDEVLTWADLCTVSAKIIYPTSGESETYLGLGESGLQQTATRNIEFVIRYMSGINEKMRVLYDDVEYDITALAEVGRRRFLRIKCQYKD